MKNTDVCNNGGKIESADDAQLFAQGKLLKLLLQNSPNNVLLIDKGGVIRCCSDAFLRLVGAENHDVVVGKKFREIFEQFETEAFIEQANRRFQAIKSGGNIYTDVRINFPGVAGGGLYTIQTIPLFDENGDFEGAQALYYDTSDLRNVEAERRLRVMLDSVPTSCIFFDSEANPVDCNQKTIILYECESKKDFLDNFFSLSPERQPDGQPSTEKAKKLIEATYKSGDQVFEWEHLTRKGDRLPCEIHLLRVQWQDGSRVVAYVQDLREIREKELQVQEADARISMLLDSQPLACSLWDLEGNILDCNQESLNLFGLPEKPEVLTRAGFLSFVPERQPDGRNSVEMMDEAVYVAIKNGYAQYEWTCVSNTGEELLLETTLVRIPWNNGYRIVAYSSNKNLIKDAEREKIKAEERMSILLDAMPIACTLRDEQHRYIDCNKEAVRMFGARSKKEFMELTHKLYPEFQPDGSPSQEKLMQLFRDVRETGYHRCEWTYHTLTGEEVPTERISVGITWKGTYCLATYVRDLREAKANEKKIREADERNRELEVRHLAAQAATKSKSQFFAAMSHEIRTPMNVIIGMCDLIRTDNLDAAQQDFFNDIKRMSKALLQIINDILDVSKIDAGKMEIHPIHFNLYEMFVNICSLNRSAINMKGLEFNYRFDDDVPHVIHGDDVRILQVVMNLLSNSAKYTKQGRVGFYVRRVIRNDNNYIVFVVEDTGIGIKEDDFGALFEEFEQFDDRENHGVMGTGLGLSISKKLIEMMDGWIEFQSEYGKGSEFSVFLPLVEGRPDKVENKELPRFVVADGDVNVLLVEDNPPNVKVALAYLKKHGIRADVAVNGLEALKMAQTKRYDLVFMDQMMPEMDGIEATKRIRALEDAWCVNMPIVGLSANAIIGSRNIFFEAGMSDFLAKPIEAAAMNGILAKWLPADKKSWITVRENVSEEKAEGKSAGVIDRRIGLRNVSGDEDLYGELAASFKFDHMDDHQKICAALEAGDKLLAQRLAHTLKSMSGLIGASGLQAAAQAVEEALSAGTEVDRGQLQALEKALGLVKAELEHVVGKQRIVKQPAGPVDMAKVARLLDELAPLLSSKNAGALELLGDINEALAPLGEPCLTLVEQIENFEFGDALETLLAVKEKVMN
ncbi:MAG: response regulator [Gracilibacteraceae bacterium]|jgi:signal transduction histidine kinase/CheY-like chemotaxis protein|nr:response regulator [Gracilibacteraceae bacterium]